MKRRKKALQEAPRKFLGIGRRAPGKKQPVNLSIDGDLLNEAREAGLNLSAIVEAHLGELLRARRRKKWLEENREAFKAHNEFVEKHGAFSDGLRKF